MRARRPTSHAEAVSRRLEQLRAELAGVRQEASDSTGAANEPSRPGAQRPAPALAADGVDGPARAPAVPMPGRHAARRRGGRLGALMPPTLSGQVALAPAHLTVVALAVAVGVAVTAWWMVRDDGEPIPAAAPLTPVVGLETPAADGSPGVTASPASVVVDVAGKVRRPGIVVLDPGSRVVDAIAAAGGVRPGVDLGSLNRARLLVDGEQILVGVPAAPGVAASAAPSSTAAGPAGLVNLNTATQEQLETLPGVGPVTAQAILDWRAGHGAFTSVEELLEVDGIGDATLADLAPHVTI